MITPTFHFEILSDFLNVMNEQTEIFMNILSEMVKKNEEIDIYKKTGLCSLDIICGKYFKLDKNQKTTQICPGPSYVKTLPRRFGPWN